MLFFAGRCGLVFGGAQRLRRAALRIPVTGFKRRPFITRISSLCGILIPLILRQSKYSPIRTVSIAAILGGYVIRADLKGAVPDCADVRTVGIPRALLWWRYGVMWQTFFEQLGRTVVLSGESDASSFERGDALSVDECCLASKLYMGHVEELVRGGACDALFIPSWANEGRFLGFCTKFQALPDIVNNTYYGRRDAPRVLSLLVEAQQTHTFEEDSFVDLGVRLGATKHEARSAYKKATVAQLRADEARRRKQRELVAKVKKMPQAQRPLTILVAAHPYVAHDPMVGKPVVDMLRDMGVCVLFSDACDADRAVKESFEFSPTLPWLVNREIVGSVANMRDEVDGVVVMSSFPCGPDSMTNDAMALRMKGVPMLTLTIDAQSGQAGLETRVESFVDILNYRRKGGYLHER